MAKQVKEEELSQEQCNSRQLFKDPKFGSLKEILEELHKLQEWDFKQSVFNHLKSGLGTYCGVQYLNAFYKDYGSDRGLGIYSSGSGTIQAVTYAGKCICETILQKPPGGGHITDPHKGHEKCIQKYSEALKACLPKLFSALLFLFFNVSNECSGIGGGQWNSYNVKGSGNSLYKWLTESDSDLPGGFLQGELHGSNTGQKVAEKLKSAVSLTLGEYDGSLQKVLCGFMFVCKWDPALTGHACLFLHKFCDEVGKDSGRNNLEGKLTESPTISFENLKRVCGQLKGKLDSLVNGTSGLSAVCHQNQKLFESLWDENKFGEYVKWLKTRLDSIIKSLQTMSSDSSQWNSSNLKDASSAGPFKYGFVFKDNNWQDHIDKNLSPVITLLTGQESGSLKSLQDCLNGKSPAISERLTTESTPSSTAATAAGAAGGIFGLGGAGVGAAYATNAFGLKDIITGLISGFLK